jgi:hypothetical protein
MRVYALLVGILLTTASSYAADVAIRSAGFARVRYALRPTADPPGPPSIWYGGVLKPITVEVFSHPRPAYTARAVDRLEGRAGCTRSSQPVRPAVAIE